VGGFNQTPSRGLELIVPDDDGDSTTNEVVRMIPVNWYVPGTQRDFSLDLWWLRDQDDGEDLKGCRIGLRSFGDSDERGQEISQANWVSVNPDNKGFTSMGGNNKRVIGTLYKNSKIPIVFRVQSPEEPRTNGRLAAEIYFDVAPQPRFYGVTKYGQSTYGRTSTSHGLQNPLGVFLVFINVLDMETVKSFKDLGFKLPGEEKVTVDLAGEKTSARGR